MKIVVNPDRLSALSSTFRGEGARLAGSENDIRRIIGSLDWEVRQKARVDGTLQSADSLAKNISSQAEVLAAKLNRGANSFRGAEKNAIQKMSSLRTRRLYLSPPFPRRTVRHFTSNKKDLYVDITGYPAAPSTSAITFGEVVDSFITIGEQIIKPHEVWKQFPELIKAQEELYKNLEKIPYVGKHIGKLGKIMPIVSFVVGTWLDYRAGMPLRIAIEKNLIETAIGLTGVGTVLLVGNAVVQLGGSGLIWLSSEPFKLITDDKHDQMIDNSRLRVQEALDRWNFENITEDAARLSDSIFFEAQANALEDFRNDPSWGNAGRLAGITFTSSVMPGSGVLFDAEARSHAWSSTRSLVGHSMDYISAPGQFTYEMLRHGVTVGEGVQSRIYDAVLPDSIADPLTDQNDRVINYINSRPPVPSFAELFNTPPSGWQDMCQEPWDLSK